MGIREIIKYPNKVLLQKTKAVSFPLSPEDKVILDDLLRTCASPADWGTRVGLAAPQIGESISAFVAQSRLYVNPEVVWLPSEGKVQSIEGCYSLEKEKSYTKWRSYAVEIKWQNYNGEIRQKRFNGFPAFVIQHELDHLEGKFCSE